MEKYPFLSAPLSVEKGVAYYNLYLIKTVSDYLPSCL